MRAMMVTMANIILNYMKKILYVINLNKKLRKMVMHNVLVLIHYHQQHQHQQQRNDQPLFM